jgi:hypothetical protein
MDKNKDIQRMRKIGQQVQISTGEVEGRIKAKKAAASNGNNSMN